MIRSILVVIYIALFLLPVGIPLLLTEWVVARFSRETMERHTLAIIQHVLRTILAIAGTQVSVTGRENIPEGRAVVFFSNHRSYFDVVIGYTLVKDLTGFVAKQEVGKVPLLAYWMRRLHCQFLDRDSAKEGLRSIVAATENVQNGISMWICPEGPRAHGETLLPFKEGSFRIALRSDAPIIPVTFVNTDDIYELHRPFIRPAKVKIHFGEPIETAGISRAEAKAMPERVQRIVQETYDKMK